MRRYLKVGMLSFAFLISVFLVACPFPGGVHPGTPGITAATGKITGKVLAQAQTDNSGVAVAAELTDGIKSVSVQKTISARQASRAVIAAQATTDANGTYTLTGLAPGVYTLNAVSKDGMEKGVVSSVTVGTGSTTQALLMVLTQTGQIKGKVTLGGGKDPTGIVVFIAGTSYSAMTDLGGNYLMSNVPAGRNYTLVASREGYVSEIRPVDVTVNKTKLMESIELRPYVDEQTAGSVSGTATLQGASTSAGIFVYLVGTSHICVTDRDGNFSLTGLASKGYTIMASKDGYSAQSKDVVVPKGPLGSISFTLISLGPYYVTYDPNEGSGTAPVDPTNYLQGFKVTVLGNSGSMAKAGNSFAGWNTEENGSGTAYTQGQTFTMGNSNVILYAKWESTESEYFASFKFDGTPVKFTEGILEFGNVPLAGPETGWEHDGHVYDRTHIIALQVGLPRELMSDNATQLEITLIGEPGTQPPPARLEPYTFTDGVHEIHDVRYSSPDFQYSVYDKNGNFGSATVIITSAGDEGFIEGTFSATVLDKYTLAPHSITDGAFRVKRFYGP